jgi:hypothetical protein
MGRSKLVAVLTVRLCMSLCLNFPGFAEAQVTPKASTQAATAPLEGLREVTVEVSITKPDDVKSPDLAGLLRQPAVLSSTIQTKIELEIRRSTRLRVVPNAP